MSWTPGYSIPVPNPDGDDAQDGDPGGGGGGTFDGVHNDLSGRSASAAHPMSSITGLTAALALLAPLLDPALTGNPTAPTQTFGSNNTRLATTAFVQAAIDAIIGTAPGILDTLGEISDAINDDANLYTTLAAAIAAKVSDTAYDQATWDGVTTVGPSKNAVRDQIEALITSITAKVSDTAYAGSWDGVTTIAPSKNVVYDKFEAVVAQIAAVVTDLGDLTLTDIDLDTAAMVLAGYDVAANAQEAVDIIVLANPNLNYLDLPVTMTWADIVTAVESESLGRTLRFTADATYSVTANMSVPGTCSWMGNGSKFLATDDFQIDFFNRSEGTFVVQSTFDAADKATHFVRVGATPWWDSANSRWVGRSDVAGAGGGAKCDFSGNVFRRTKRGAACTVAVASNGANIADWTTISPGTLTVGGGQVTGNPTDDFFTPYTLAIRPEAIQGHLQIQTSAGEMWVTYTSKDATHFYGCVAVLGRGTGTLSTNNYVRQASVCVEVSNLQNSHWSWNEVLSNITTYRATDGITWTRSGTTITVANIPSGHKIPVGGKVFVVPVGGDVAIPQDGAFTVTAVTTTTCSFTGSSATGAGASGTASITWGADVGLLVDNGTRTMIGDTWHVSSVAGPWLKVTTSAGDTVTNSTLIRGGLSEQTTGIELEDCAETFMDDVEVNAMTTIDNRFGLSFTSGGNRDRSGVGTPGVGDGARFCTDASFRRVKLRAFLYGMYSPTGTQFGTIETSEMDYFGTGYVYRIDGTAGTIIENSPLVTENPTVVDGPLSWSATGGVVTVTGHTDHGFNRGKWIVTSRSRQAAATVFPDGVYQVQDVLSSSSYTFTAATGATSAGDSTLYVFSAGSYISVPSSGYDPVRPEEAVIWKTEYHTLVGADVLDDGVTVLGRNLDNASETLYFQPGRRATVLANMVRASTSISFLGATPGKFCEIKLICRQNTSPIPGVLTFAAGPVIVYEDGAAPKLQTAADSLDTLYFSTVDGGATVFVSSGGSTPAPVYTDHSNTGSSEDVVLLNGANNWDRMVLNNATVTLSFSGATSGRVCRTRLEIVQDGTGSRSITWPGAVVWPNGVAPVLKRAASAVTIVDVVTVDGGTTIYGQAVEDPATAPVYTDHSNTGAAETVALIPRANDWHRMVLDNNTVTLTVSVLPAAGQSGKICRATLEIVQDATGGRAITWPAAMVWPNGIAPVLKAAANAVTLVEIATVDAGTTIYGQAVEDPAPAPVYTDHSNTGATEIVTFVPRANDWHKMIINSATVTVSFTGAVSGKISRAHLEIVQDATGGRLITWPGAMVWEGGTAPTLVATANGITHIDVATLDGGTTIYGSSGIIAKNYTDSTVAALPSLSDGTEVSFAASGSPPSAILTPALSSAAAIRILGKVNGGSTVTSTTTATSLLASTITPAASSVAVGDRLIIKAWGAVLNNSGGAATFTFRFRYGSSNLWTSGAVSLATNAQLRPYRIEIEAIILSASSGTLSCIGTAIFGEATGAGVNTDTFQRTTLGTDTVVALGGWSALDLTVQHSTSGSTQSTAPFGGGLIIEHIKA